ncbi:hypothetical protein [Caulobacter segnis]|uniref:Uncharacterized protein n=1 Tax=Caulobacter segnis (strain ATCC 21756 / DSM 7131 / JCM 7823 / NBRC 15250 / LMG 17158 / TK0059) TaxID=509190 RepID=D5VL97_CAUST|nr:hypothetical protein [Caulobacter segnis]ADG11270.1 hypothetical protein Cseg_2822 [Caulobacter segnis ATCC 21756]
MATQIHLAPGGAPVPTPSIRRISFDRPLAVGAAMAMWVLILIGLRLLTL